MLVVDDDPLVARIIGIRLAKAGYEVRSAASAQEGLNLARTWLPDVCVVDKGLPGRDGAELARDLRVDPATVGIRILLISGSFWREEDLLPHDGAPYDAALGKPFTGEQLLEHVGRLTAPAFTSA